MASSWPVPAAELSCPVCQNVFRDPVLLPCSHSFCNDCVRCWWRTKKIRQCPVCKAVSSPSNTLPRNLVLKNLCEAFLLEVESGVVCRLHTEKLKLYCLDHRTPVCLVCRDSRQHRDHRFTPVEEAAEIYRDDLVESLKPLREKVKLYNEVKAKWEKTQEGIRNQAQDTEMKVREEFRVLREFLETEEEVRIAALKEEGELKRKVMQDKIACLTRQINALESTIKTTEEGLTQEDTSFLLKASALKEEAQRPLPDDPQQVTGAMIDVAKYLGNMSFSVWCKMKEIVSYTPVILNPNTAHEELHLSECLTSVRCGPAQPLASTPERMEQHRCVLGFEGFSAGSHRWDVEVGDSPVWALGVIAQDAQRTGNILSGLWMVRFCHGKFQAFCPSRPVSLLPLKDRPQRVTVHLDWDEGTLSFSDPDADTVIHTFRHTFTKKLFPYVNTWNDLPLKILPLKLSVMMT
ncbi:nuclear factor 7, brain-like [Xiphias gladius]|uniref:nuclear factor 7, brain-like n=1 Tax=Xiphias gladius TaxID=8245 RepID=UPI001A99FEB6|nr:nuclear factor 7, brain-like [Xiphias gladius]